MYNANVARILSRQPKVSLKTVSSGGLRIVHGNRRKRSSTTYQNAATWLSETKSRMRETNASLFSASMLPVTSSSSSDFGFAASADATATLCRWPPLSRNDPISMKFSGGSSPTEERQASTLLLATSSGVPFGSRRNRAMSEPTLGITICRWGFWSTNAAGRPSSTVPSVGLRRPRITLMSVDLPQPLWPTSIASSPGRMVRETSRRTCWPFGRQ